MKLVKNKLPTIMTQDRLTNLCLLSIESDVLRSLNFEGAIKQFYINKSRKMYLLLLTYVIYCLFLNIYVIQ